MPPNLALAENDCLPRAAVTERENVQRFESGTCWLRIERPLRLIVSVTLPGAGLGLGDGGRERDRARDRALGLAALDVVFLTTLS